MVLATLATLPMLSACNIIAPAVFLVEGPPKIDARFELPEKASVVVFVDDMSSPPMGRATRLAIARAAQEDLLKARVVARVIDASAAFEAASTETASRKLDVQTIGRSVGADLVIHATIDSFTLTANEAEYMPTAVFRAKVIDTRIEDGARIWPVDEPRGATITAQPSQRPRTMPQSRGEADRARGELATLTGQTLAKLFYTHDRWQSVGGR
jgi:hypothetical protein